jgi:hypothetical protein
MLARLLSHVSPWQAPRSVAPIPLAEPNAFFKHASKRGPEYRQGGWGLVRSPKYRQGGLVQDAPLASWRVLSLNHAKTGHATIPFPPVCHLALPFPPNC